MNKNYLAVKLISKTYFAFSLMFGFYLLSHGHESHGAGTAGGILILLGFTQALIVLGREKTAGVINHRNALVLLLSAAGGFLVMAALGYFYGKGILSNFIGAGGHTLFSVSGTAVIYNLLLCAGAAGSLGIIFLSFFALEDKGQ